METLVEHAGDGVTGIVDDKIGDGALHLVGHGVMLHGYEEHRQLLFLVFAHEVDALVVVGHFHGFHLGGVLWHLDAGEEFLHFLFGAIDIDVAHDDDALVVGTVPFAIVCPQGLW